MAHLEDSFSQTRAKRPARKSSSAKAALTPICKKRKLKGAKNKDRKHTSFLLVHGPVSPSCEEAKEGNEVQREHMKAMLDHLWQADFDIIVAINPHHSKALTLTDTLPGTEDSKVPNKWNLQAYSQHFFLQMRGSEPEHQICVKHDDTLDKLLKNLASLEQPNGFHFSKHPHQTWKVVQCCWLH